MIYNYLKQKNKFIKKDINRHKNLRVKIEKIHSSITFLIKCRNSGIIPDFIKNAMVNIYNILESNRTKSDFNLQKTLVKHIENFQTKVLNIVIKHKYDILKAHNEEKIIIEKVLNNQLSEEESRELWFNEILLTRNLKGKTQK